MSLLLVHLPHLLLAAGALGLSVGVERSAPRRHGVAGPVLGLAVALVTAGLAVPMLRGDHPGRSATLAYLLVCAASSARLAWVTPARLPAPLRTRLGRSGGAAAAAVMGLIALGAYLYAGNALAHGQLV